MPRQQQDINYNVTGQKLFFYAPEGRPSSVTSVSVFKWDEDDDATGESATTGSASVTSSPNGTVSGTIGAGQADPRLITVDSLGTGPFSGEEYIVQDTLNNVWEFVELGSWDTIANEAYSKFPLQNSYPSGSKFQTTRMEIAIEDTWIQDADNISTFSDPNPGYRVRWQYVTTPIGTLTSRTFVRYSYFDVVRSDVRHDVTAESIERLMPGFIAALPSFHRGDRGRSMIDEAYQQVVLDLHQQGIHEDQVRNSGVIDDLVKRKTITLWSQARVMTGQDDPALAEFANEQYMVRWNQLIKGPSEPKIPIADDQGGDGASFTTIGITRR